MKIMLCEVYKTVNYPGGIERVLCNFSNELIKRGYSVDVGVVVDRRNGANSLKEIDFVVNEGDRRIYIQSALRMDDEEKIKSELDSFKLTNDFFKKIIIRNDITHNYYDENGIYHCCLSDFLLNRIQLF